MAANKVRPHVVVAPPAEVDPPSLQVTDPANPARTSPARRVVVTLQSLQDYRPPSRLFGAAELVTQIAQAYDPELLGAFIRLAWNESGLRLGYPAHTFNIVPNTPNPITAWGTFQFNRGAVRRLRLGPNYWPWGVHAIQEGRPVYDDLLPYTPGRMYSPQDEVTYPIWYYTQVARVVRSYTADPGVIEMVLRLHHMGPNYARRYLRLGKTAAAADPYLAGRIRRVIVHNTNAMERIRAHGIAVPEFVY